MRVYSCKQLLLLSFLRADVVGNEFAVVPAVDQGVEVVFGFLF